MTKHFHTPAIVDIDPKKKKLIRHYQATYKKSKNKKTDLILVLSQYFGKISQELKPS